MKILFRWLVVLLVGLQIGCNSGSSSKNSSITANAGSDQTVSPSMTVSLVGSGSDSDGMIANWQWRQLSGSLVTLTDADQATASFISPAVIVSEQLVFELTVTDGDGASASDQVTVTVDPAVNRAPTVDAGSDQSVSVSEVVTLVSSSADTDGEVIAWQWVQLSGTSVTNQCGPGECLFFQPVRYCIGTVGVRAECNR
jgi:hypothetical protein